MTSAGAPSSANSGHRSGRPRELRHNLRPGHARIVVNRCDVDDSDRFGDQGPDPVVALADLLLGNGMSTGGHPVPHALDRQRFGDEHRMQHHRVSVGVCTMDQVDLRSMREHRLGDERTPRLDKFHPGLCGQPRRIVGVRGHLVGPTSLGDFVGVDEQGPRQQGRQREGNKGRLARPVGADNEVEPPQGVGSTITEVPSGRYSTMRPSSSRATVVTPRSARMSP